MGVTLTSCLTSNGLATVLVEPPGSHGFVLILFRCLGDIKAAGSGIFPKNTDDVATAASFSSEDAFSCVWGGGFIIYFQ